MKIYIAGHCGMAGGDELERGQKRLEGAIRTSGAHNFL